jgi:hypothetical protein
MPYRAPTEREPEPPAAESGLQCHRCNVPIPLGADRCPKCLRRSTVVDADGLGPNGPTSSLGENRPKAHESAIPVWPRTRTCPVCGKVDVGASNVFLRVSKAASGFGTVSTSVFVRIRTCEPCRARVAFHDTSRYVLATTMIVGMGMMFGLFVPTTGSIAVGICGVVLAVGSFGTFVTRNRRLRALLDASGLTAEVALRLPTPSGIFEFENASLHASVPKGRGVVEIAEIVQEEALTGPESDSD